MSLFNLFKRNKNAKTAPLAIQDYRSFTGSFIEKDPVSFSAIDKIGTAFASLSFGVYDTRTKQKTKHPLYDVLKEPNADETHSLFFYELIQDYFAGNVYLYKYTDADGQVISLFRLNPNQVTVTRNEYNQKLYSYNGQTYTSEKVLHIPSRYSYDGLTGKSIWKTLNHTFKQTQNLDEYVNNTFDNSLGKRLVIDLSSAYPNATEQEQNQIRDRYVANYSGSENAGKPVVKTGKIDFQTIDTGVSDNRSAQLSENRQYQAEIIAQIFNVPVAYLTGKDVGDLETVTTLFMSQAIEPIAQAFEEAFIKLLPVEQRERYYIKFSYNSLLKTNLSAKISAYTQQLTNGILSPNEIRQKEELEPIEYGDCHYRASNLLPIRQDIEESLVASAKLKQQEVDKDIGQQKNAEAKDIGSDKL